MPISKLSEQAIKDVIQWDVKTWSKLIPFFTKHVSIESGMKVLTLGEREGGLSLFFSLQQCKVNCTDYNPLPKETAQLHSSYEVSELITYGAEDMKTLSFPDDTFDIVAFKSVIGALGNREDQTKAMAEIHRVLKKDGHLIFAENAAGSALHQSLRKRFISWAEGWRYVNKNDIEEWGKKFNHFTYKKEGFFATFGRSENQRKLLFYIDRFYIWMTPNKWKYVFFGVFTK